MDLKGQRTEADGLEEGQNPGNHEGGEKPEDQERADPKISAEEGQRPPEDLEKEGGEGEGENGEKEDGEIKDGDVEGLSAKAQAKINARIHELNIKRKNAETRAEDAETRAKVLESRYKDENVQAVTKLGLHPDYFTDGEAKTIKRFHDLRGWKKWLSTHREGYEGSDDKYDPSMSAAKVAEHEAAVDDELLDIAGPARTLWLERSKQMEEDRTRGREARLADAKRKKSGIKPALKPPTLPTRSGATRKPPVSGARGKAGFDETEFKKDGAGKDALEKQYEKIFG